jgi:predicted nucleotidyltransferase
MLATLREAKAMLSDRFGIREFGVFGSTARGEENEHSDVDIAIISIDKKDYFTRANAKYYLENLLGKKVDIGYLDSMRPIVRQFVLKDLIRV